MRLRNVVQFHGSLSQWGEDSWEKRNDVIVLFENWLYKLCMKKDFLHDMVNCQ